MRQYCHTLLAPHVNIWPHDNWVVALSPLRKTSPVARRASPGVCLRGPSFGTQGTPTLALFPSTRGVAPRPLLPHSRPSTLALIIIVAHILLLPPLPVVTSVFPATIVFATPLVKVAVIGSVCANPCLCCRRVLYVQAHAHTIRDRELAHTRFAHRSTVVVVVFAASSFAMVRSRRVVLGIAVYLVPMPDTAN